MTQTTFTKTDATGVTFGGHKISSDFVVGGKFVPWSTLKAAAVQEDKALAAAYADVLARAEKAEASRQTSENWKQYGYPLRTGFNGAYRGQIVMCAWEIRRVQRKGVDAHVGYIVEWDRSTNTTSIIATSPELPDFDAATAWVRENYGSSTEDIGGERTASTWLYA
jgi:hypothetical protein